MKYQIELDDYWVHWYKNHELHRLYGPAMEYYHGVKDWYKDGKQHRLDGPAVEYLLGKKAWYIDGYFYTEEEFKRIQTVKK